MACAREGVVVEAERFGILCLFEEEVLNKVAFDRNQVLRCADRRKEHQQPARMPVVAVMGRAAEIAGEQAWIVRRRVQPVVETAQDTVGVRVARHAGREQAPGQPDAVVVASLILPVRFLRVHVGLIVRQAASVGRLAGLDRVHNRVDDRAHIGAFAPAQGVTGPAEQAPLR